MSDYTPDLPQELITEILLRLPAKSIGQFRCVSRPWRSLLTNPDFIKSHLALQESHEPENFILISDSDRSLYTLSLNPIGSRTSSHDAVARRISFGEFEVKWETLVGSCHGLVLLETDENSIFLMNPTTLEGVKIPDFSLALDPLTSFCMHGFGYDDISDDYKIVRVSYNDTVNELDPDSADTVVDVYSVKKRTWRRVLKSPYYHNITHPSSGVLLDGTLHWLACDDSAKDNPSVIVAFSLKFEVFDEVPAPNSLDKKTFMFNNLVALGGCLGMVVDHDNGQIDVWVMKEYGVQESWTKFTVKVPDKDDIIKPICELRDDKIVLEKDNEKLVLYSLTEDTLTDLVITGLPDMFEDGILTFLENLQSPSFDSQVEERQMSGVWIPEV